MIRVDVEETPDWYTMLRRTTRHLATQAGIFGSAGLEDCYTRLETMVQVRLDDAIVVRDAVIKWAEKVVSVFI